MACARVCIRVSVFVYTRILYISALCVMIRWKMGWGFSTLSWPICSLVCTTGSFIWEIWLFTAVVYDFQCVCAFRLFVCNITLVELSINLFTDFDPLLLKGQWYIFTLFFLNFPQNVFSVFHYSSAIGAWVPCSGACWQLLLRIRRAPHILPPCAGSDNVTY